MANYIKSKISLLVVGDTIMWDGHVCQVVEKLSMGVKVREFKRRKVAEREFKDRWHTITVDVEVDKVLI
jgi:hypothetical protein